MTESILGISDDHFSKLTVDSLAFETAIVFLSSEYNSKSQVQTCMDLEGNPMLYIYIVALCLVRGLLSLHFNAF